MSSQQAPSLLRKRDFCILGIVALLTYISLQTKTFTYRLEPAWYLDQRPSVTGILGGEGKPSNKHSEWYVPPIITDLDGDGSKEIIIITKDMQLKIVSAETSNHDTSEIYTPEEIATVSLSNLNLHKGKAPVALHTGYADPYNPTTERSQVIVVVKEDWSVACYDSSLRLMWEKAVAHKTHEIDTIINKYKIDQVAVHISPLTLTEGSTGVVIVGASMGLRHPEDAAHIDIEHGIDLHEDGSIEHSDLNLQSTLSHFSLYALDAADGHIVWKHDGTDVKPEQYSRSLPQHAYKLDVKDLATKVHHAPGFNHWSIFKQSLIAELPHDWHVNDDTSLRIAHFVRKHMGAGQNRESIPKSSASAGAKGTKGRALKAGNNDASKRTGDPAIKIKGKRRSGNLVSGEGSRFTGVETPPLPQSATLPHDASEHTDHPNVVVAHTKKGVEVISLKTGVPLTSLALAQGKTYADIDGDGVVDTILVLETVQDVASHGEAFAHEAGQLQHCMVMVTSGLPPKSQLFNGTVCPNRHNLQDPMLHSQKHNALPSAVSAASPVVLRTIDKKTMQESKLRDLVIAINTGIVTCYSGNGALKWQVKGAPSWAISDLDHPSHSASLFDADASRVDGLGKHDNVHANLLIVGDYAVGLVSRDGELLTYADIPKRPVARPIIGDFDSDGVTDVIILTEEAVLGYRLEVVQSTQSMLIAVIVLSVLAGIVFFANIRTNVIGLGSSTPSSQTISSSQIKKSVLSLVRSTDEYHID